MNSVGDGYDVPRIVAQALKKKGKAKGKIRFSLFGRKSDGSTGKMRPTQSELRKPSIGMGLVLNTVR